MQEQVIESLNDLEFTYSIRGGYVLKTNAQTVYPACCGSLEDIESWEMAAGWQKPKWEMIWIGHPWIYCRHDGAQLEFTLPTESSDNLAPAFSVAPIEL